MTECRSERYRRSTLSTGAQGSICPFGSLVHILAGRVQACDHKRHMETDTGMVTVYLTHDLKDFAQQINKDMTNYSDDGIVEVDGFDQS